MSFLGTMRERARERAREIVVRDPPYPPPRPFRESLVSGGFALIAEVKYATPRDGLLGVDESPQELAREFERLGARALSCLTEPAFFAGRPEHLAMARRGASLPVMMKDFVVDIRQILLGRSFGADAVLLITEMLDRAELEDLLAFARSLGMECLVEVHGHRGLEKALAAGAGIIGVNCRDLDTLKVFPGRHEEMAPELPGGVVKVAESGIESGERLGCIARAGYDAALVGRAFAQKGLREEIFRVGQDLRHNAA